jgi:hypothetical protein
MSFYPVPGLNNSEKYQSYHQVNKFAKKVEQYLEEYRIKRRWSKVL